MPRRRPAAKHHNNDDINAGTPMFELPPFLRRVALTTASALLLLGAGPARAQGTTARLPAADATRPAARAPARPASAATASKPAASKPAAAASAGSAGADASRTPGFSIAPPPAWVQPATVEPIPADLPTAPVQMALIDRQTRLLPGGSHQYRRSLRLVKASAGLEQAAQIEVEFDPGYQRLVLHELTIVRAGQRLNKLDAAQVKLLHREPQLERQMIDGRMTAALVLDDLRVGDALDFAYSVIGDNPVFGGRFVETDWTLGALGPAALYRYRLLSPAARTIRHQTDDSAVQVSSTVVGSERETVFTRRNAPMFRADPYAPGSVYLKDQLQLSEFADWADVARWADQLFASAAQPGPEVRARAEAIRAAQAEPAQRLRAALDLVQNEVRYFGTEIGANSHQPAAAEQVLRQRFGDCKDKVALLMALARALDLPVQPVLVSTRYQAQVQGMLPSPLAFDHAIAAVTLDGRTLWLDGTRSQQTGEPATRQSVGLGFGLPARDGVAALAALPPAADVLRVEAEDVFRFDQPMSGGATLEARETFHGDMAELIRAGRAALPQAEFNRQIASDHLRAYPGLVTDGDAVLAEVPGRNAVTVTQRYRWAEPWRFPRQRQLTLEFAMTALMAVLRLPDQSPPTQALRIAYPGIYRQTLRLDFPEPVFSKPSAQKLDEAHGLFTLALAYEGSTSQQTVSAELRLPADRIEPTEWPRHRDALVKAWPRLNNTLAISALTPAQSEQLRTRFAALDQDLQRGRLKLVTPVQREAQARLVALDAQLAGTRLSPKLRVEALKTRGEQLDHLGRLAAARDDFLAALAIDPAAPGVAGALATNALLRGADEEAVQRATQELAAVPSDSAARSMRAYAHYFRQAWAPAQDDLTALLASRSEVERSYPQLWLYLAHRQAGGDGLSAIAAHVPVAAQPAWPYPVLQHFKGQLTLDQALAAARDESGKPDPGRLCELHFFAGQKALVDGDLARARSHFQKSIDTGVVEFIEHGLAQRALEALRGR
jgi:lipoprotein NlpI